MDKRWQPKPKGKCVKEFEHCRTCGVDLGYSVEWRKRLTLCRECASSLKVLRRVEDPATLIKQIQKSMVSKYCPIEQGPNAFGNTREEDKEIRRMERLAQIEYGRRCYVRV